MCSARYTGTACVCAECTTRRWTATTRTTAAAAAAAAATADFFVSHEA